MELWGSPDVRAFADGLERHGSLAVIYATERGICTESLDVRYFNPLKQMDAGRWLPRSSGLLS